MAGQGSLSLWTITAPIPAPPGAYLASLTDKAPTTVPRRLATLGKMHRWNPAHRDIRGPLDGLLRAQGRPVARRPQ
jgi:hypothetical protein